MTIRTDGFPVPARNERVNQGDLFIYKHGQTTRLGLAYGSPGVPRGWLILREEGVALHPETPTPYFDDHDPSKTVGVFKGEVFARPEGFERVDKAGDGALTIDANGEAFVYAPEAGEPGRNVYLSLAEAALKEPASPRFHYAKWSLIVRDGKRETVLGSFEVLPAVNLTAAELMP